MARKPRPPITGAGALQAGAAQVSGSLYRDLEEVRRNFGGLKLILFQPLKLRAERDRFRRLAKLLDKAKKEMPVTWTTEVAAVIKMRARAGIWVRGYGVSLRARKGNALPHRDWLLEMLLRVWVRHGGELKFARDLHGSRGPLIKFLLEHATPLLGAEMLSADGLATFVRRYRAARRR